jgi:hypothetical protein
MRIKDHSYYKKNTLSRYLISKELEKHRNAVKQEKAKKLNDFIIPVFSATLTICSSYFLKVLEIFDNFFWLELTIVAGFISIYFLSVSVIKVFHNIVNYIKIRQVGPDINENESDIIDLLEYFNIDIINQVLLSYTLIKDSVEQEIENKLKNHYIFESFFYLKSSLDKMNDDIFTTRNISSIFTQNRNYIEAYRISLVFDMLRETYEDIVNSDIFKSPDFVNDLDIAISIFDRLTERLKGYVDIEPIKSV